MSRFLNFLIEPLVIILAGIVGWGIAVLATKLAGVIELFIWSIK